MKIWETKTQKHIETPKEMVNFFEEIDKICKKYNLSISHEDHHGAFEIVRYDERYIEWLKAASKDY